MTLIKALLRDQVLTLIETPVIASGGVEEDVVSFDFGVAAWDGYTKKAVFYRDESDVYHVDIGSDNTAVIPWEVLRQEGFMFLGVFGTKGSEIKTSTVARYRVENGAITTASELNPTPNIYNDIIANTAARHSHDNKTVLDGITADDVAKWDETNCTTYIKVDSTDDVISTVNGETYADIQALIDADKPVVVRFDDGLDFYYFETFRFSDSSGVHIRLNFRCNMGSSVFTLTLKEDNTWLLGTTELAKSSDIPTALKNPNALTIKVGSTTVTYDGSAAKTVEIADGSEVSY